MVRLPAARGPFDAHDQTLPLPTAPRAARAYRLATGTCWVLAGLVVLAGMVITPWEGSRSPAAYYDTMAQHPERTKAAAVVLHFGFLLYLPAVLGSLAILHGPGRYLGYAAGVLAILGGSLSGLLVGRLYQVAMIQVMDANVARAASDAASDWAMAWFTWPARLGFLLAPVVAAFGLAMARVMPVWVAGGFVAATAALAFSPPLPMVSIGAATLAALGAAAVGTYILQASDHDWARGALRSQPVE